MVENSILSDLIFHPDDGALKFNDVRYLLIRPETLASFQVSLEEEVGLEKASRVLYSGGFTGGKLSGLKYKEVFKLGDREAVEFMCKMGGEIGWGAMALEELDSNQKSLAVRVVSSPFAEAYTGKADHACHLIRGVFGGLATGIFESEVEAIEVDCVSGVADSCLFVVKKK